MSPFLSNSLFVVGYLVITATSPPVVMNVATRVCICTGGRSDELPFEKISQNFQKTDVVYNQEIWDFK